MIEGTFHVQEIAANHVMQINHVEAQSGCQRGRCMSQSFRLRKIIASCLVVSVSLESDGGGG